METKKEGLGISFSSGMPMSKMEVRLVLDSTELEEDDDNNVNVNVDVNGGGGSGGVDTVESSLVKAIEEAIPRLEREHSVRVSRDAVVCAAQQARRHFTAECSLEEKVVEIVNSACLVFEG